jgi:hypothetical protein
MPLTQPQRGASFGRRDKNRFDKMEGCSNRRSSQGGRRFSFRDFAQNKNGAPWKENKKRRPNETKLQSIIAAVVGTVK